MYGSIALLAPDRSVRFIRAGRHTARALRDALGSQVEYQVLSPGLTLWAARACDGPPNPLATTLTTLLTGAVCPLTGPVACTGPFTRQSGVTGLSSVAELDLRRWLDAIIARPDALAITEQAGRVASAWATPDRTRLDRNCTSPQAGTLSGSEEARS